MLKTQFYDQTANIAYLLIFQCKKPSHGQRQETCRAPRRKRSRRGRCNICSSGKPCSLNGFFKRLKLQARASKKSMKCDKSPKRKMRKQCSFRPYKNFLCSPINSLFAKSYFRMSCLLYAEQRPYASFINLRRYSMLKNEF